MTRRAWLWAVVGGLLGLAVAAGWLAFVTASDLATASALAGVVSTFLALGATAVALLRQARPPPPDLVGQAQLALAAEVQIRWRDESTILGLGDRMPIPVRWTIARTETRAAPSPGDPSTADLMDHGVPGGLAGSSDQVTALVDQFRRLPHQRLVILGGAGAGKSTLAVQFLLGLLAPPADGAAVPVLLSLAGWDTTVHRRLHDWVGAQLGEQYPVVRSSPFGPDVCLALARQRLVLPILDGLDELSQPARIAVLNAINASLAPDDKVIITCRTSEFVDTVQVSGRCLTGAAVIEPHPLQPAEVARYLAACLPSRPGAQWQRLLDELNSGADSPLAQTLSSPLGVWLLRSVYPTLPGTDPTPLLDTTTFPTAHAVESHLLNRLVTRLVERDETRLATRRRRWTADEVEQWLGYLAAYLTRAGTSDFAWWNLARNTLTTAGLWSTLGVALAAAITATAAFGFGPVTGLSRGLVAAIGGLRGGLAGGMIVGAGSAAALWLAFANSSARWLGSDPGSTESGIRSILNRRLLGGALVGSLFAIAGGFVVGTVGGLSAGLGFGLTSGATFGMASGVTFGLSGELTFRLIDWADNRSRSSTPLSTLRADRTLTIAATGIVWLTFGIAFGAVVGTAFAIAHILAGALGGRYSQAWISYVLATLKLAAAGKLPVRLSGFLDHVYTLGLLRTNGPVYQFRHATLQAHLVANHRQGRR